MTRLSYLHEYPAMMANGLAARLAQELVSHGTRVLDPFCGTGRTLLAAAERGGDATGVDANPLAVLIANAKAYRGSVQRLRDLRHGVERRNGERGRLLELDPGRKVEFFSEKAIRELCLLIDTINESGLRGSLLLLAAAVLSATAREVSYCRLDQWKLHRLGPLKRPQRAKASAVAIFLRRIDRAIEELDRRRCPGKCRAVLGDARDLQRALRTLGAQRRYDCIITSPPYGDSRTTVQYGGVSSLSLGVLQHLDRLEIEWQSTGCIDRACLGGVRDVPVGSPAAYWAGRAETPSATSVARFLEDTQEACRQIFPLVRRNGTVVFVVSRRCVRGRRVYLDQCILDAFAEDGWRCVKRERRTIVGKVTPARINLDGNAKKAVQTMAPTMREEIILWLRASPRPVYVQSR